MNAMSSELLCRESPAWGQSSRPNSRMAIFFFCFTGEAGDNQLFLERAGGSCCVERCRSAWELWIAHMMGCRCPGFPVSGGSTTDLTVTPPSATSLVNTSLPLHLAAWDSHSHRDEIFSSQWAFSIVSNVALYPGRVGCDKANAPV